MDLHVQRMSTETGAEKRRLSRSKSEEGANEIATTENINSSEESDTRKHLDEQQQGQKHGHEKNEKKDGNTTLRITTIGEEDTIVTTTNINNNVIPGDGSRQIIAVSANKNPTAFFQLARKFLMTNEMCDLSALEGAIVSAVDAAHLLERSKLASIVRIHTSYVNVEPKRRRQVSQQKGEVSSIITTEGVSSSTITEDGLPCSKAEFSSLNTNVTSTEESSQTLSSLVSSYIPDSKKSIKVNGTQQGGQQSTTISATRNPVSNLSGSGSRELRRARILVTVRRTESYKRWLEDNPTQRQAIIAGTATVTAEEIVGGGSLSNNNNTADLSATMKQT